MLPNTDQMVARTLQAVAEREALSGCRAARERAGLTDERASGVGDIQHQPPSHAGQVLCRIAARHIRRAAVTAHRDETRHQAMHLIRHLQHVVVGKPALCCVAVEQRWLRCPVQDQGEFPGDIAGIHERGVEALTAEWAGQVGSITQQEAPSVAQMCDLAPVHRERRNPAEIT